LPGLTSVIELKYAQTPELREAARLGDFLASALDFDRLGLWLFLSAII